MLRSCLLSLALVACAVLAAQTAVTAQSVPTAKVSQFASRVDHFFTPSDGQPPATFQQRILTADQYWTDKTGPVLVYTGNEGDVTAFYDNTGIIFEWAASLKALVIFLEHRYYGTSLPFGDQSFTPENLRFLTIEQALEDYAVIIDSLQRQYGLVGDAAVPWISVGGSYGGILAAWIRLKYGSLIAGAIAASAPIKYVSPNVDYSYFAAATQDYAARGSDCVDAVRLGYKQLQALIDAEEYVQIQKELRLCETPTAATVEHIKLWSVNSLLSLAQYDYPYSVDFDAQLPANPVNVACSILTTASSDSALELLGQAVGIFYNGTSDSASESESSGDVLQCFDPKTDFIECADQTGCGLGPSGTAWDFQACSQFVCLYNTNGESDMFPPHSFNLTDLTAYCQAKYGVTPDPDILAIDFGGARILQEASNIVFSSGSLDPFRAGSFLPTQAKASHVHPGVLVQELTPKPDASILLLLIEGGAHHFDLRGTNPLDPPAVTKARQVELDTMRQWIAQFQADKAKAVVAAKAKAVDQAQVVLDQRWSHTGRAAREQPTSFSLALVHGDRERLSDTFERVFDPEHADYLDYPAEASLRAMLQPSEEALVAVREWLASSVCTGVRPSCTVAYSEYMDLVTVRMHASHMEDFLNGAQLHVYQCAGQAVVRSSLTSLEHLLPSHLHAHVAFTRGLTHFPREVKAHGSRADDPSFVLSTPPEAPRVRADQPPLQEDPAQARGRIAFQERLTAASALALGSPVDNTVLSLTRMSTSDGQLNVVLLLLACQLSPQLVLAQFVGDTPYCMLDRQLYAFQSLQVMVTDLDGNQRETSTTLFGMAQQTNPDGTVTLLAATQIDIDVDNYAGYKLEWQVNYEGQFLPVHAAYPFLLSATQLVRPAFLKSYLGLPRDFSAQLPSTRLGIGALVVRGGPGFYSPSDLKTFWSRNSLADTPNASWIDYSTPVQTNDPSQPDGETQLDIQFGMGMLASGAGSGTIYHVGSDTPFDDIVRAALVNTPTVLSFSYGGSEADNNSPAGAIDHTNELFQALALKGVSIFVSSGDTGAFMPAQSGLLADTCAKFSPSFPGSSPYVTSVGASQLKSDRMGACPFSVQSSVEYGSGITGGGGFSLLQSQPKYQAAFVQAWQKNANCSKPTLLKYNVTNRAYPDLVAFGHDYVTVTNGDDGRVDGTSASAPSMAGVFAVIMDLRKRNGLRPLGFLNPLLYSAAQKEPRSFTDITVGSNRCLERGMPGCCPEAFSACTSFDPVTGLGTPNFQYLQKALNVTLQGQVLNLIPECGGDDGRRSSEHRKLTIILCSVVGGVSFLLILLFCVRRRMRLRKLAAGAVQSDSAYARMS